MNTRGKKIGFAEMLTQSLRLTDRTTIKSAKPAKKRATSLDGTAKIMTSSNALAGRKAGFLLDADSPQSATKIASDRGNRRSLPDSSLQPLISAGEMRVSDVVELSPAREMMIGSGEELVPVHHGWWKVKPSVGVPGADVEHETRGGGSEKKQRSFNNRDSSVTVQSIFSLQGLERNPSKEVTVGDCDLNAEERVKAEASSPSVETSPSSLTESCGRSTRKNRPLDYKCLAGLRGNQRKRKSSESETTGNRLMGKMRTDTCAKGSKKVRLEGDNRKSALEMSYEDVTGKNKRPNDHLSTGKDLLAPKPEPRSCEKIMTVKMENENVCRNVEKEASASNTMSITSLSKLSNIKPSKEVSTARLNVKQFEVNTPIKLEERPVDFEQASSDDIMDRDNYSVLRSFGCSDGFHGESRNGVTEPAEDATLPRTIHLDATGEASGNGDVNSEANVEGSDAEMTPSAAVNYPRRPYDNAQLSNLIEKIEARMNKIKNSADFGSGTPANSSLSNRPRGKKSIEIREIKVEKVDRAECSGEDIHTPLDGRSACSNTERMSKKLSPRELAVNEDAVIDKNRTWSCDYPTAKFNRTDAVLQEIGRTRIHARKSLELSLARAVGTCLPERSSNNSVGKSHHALNSKALHSKMENDVRGNEKAKRSLRIENFMPSYSCETSGSAQSNSKSSSSSSSSQSSHAGISTKSVFISQELDSYLASNSHLLSGKEKTKRSTCEPEIDEIDGFTFMAFASQHYLEEHMKKLGVEREARFDFAQSPSLKHEKTKPYAGHASRTGTHLPAHTRTITSEEIVACRKKREMLEKSGKIRKFTSDGLADLSLTIHIDPSDLLGVDASPEEGTCVAKITRRGIGKMGNEKRQPCKGKIYGRKVTGRFASKANIRYYVKKRSPDSLVQPDEKDGKPEKQPSANKRPTVRKGMTSTARSVEPVIVTMKMAITAIRALNIESAAEKPCNQRDCTCSGWKEIQPEYEPDLSNEDLPDVMCSTPACNREHCRLGCICESLQTPQKRKQRVSHCGRPECMFNCVCDPITLMKSPCVSNSEPEAASPGFRHLLDTAGMKEQGDRLPQKAADKDLCLGLRKRKRRGWGIPIADCSSLAEESLGNGQSLRKSGRIKGRRHFGDIEKMKSLIYYDASLWLRDDQGKPKRKRVEKQLRTDEPKLLAAESSTAKVAPVLSGEGSTNPETFKPEPLAFEISDDEKPDIKAEFSDKKEDEVLPSRASRVEVPELEKGTVLKSILEECGKALSLDFTESKMISDDEILDDKTESCARLLPYSRPSKKLVEETQNSCTASSSASDGRFESARCADISRPALSVRCPKTSLLKESSMLQNQKLLSPKLSDPVPNKFTKSVMLVKKNPTGKDKPEGRKLVGPVILLDIICNCYWQEHRDHIVGTVYEMFAEGQAIAGKSFEVKNLLVELMPKSAKALPIPEDIREKTKVRDVHVVPIRITKKTEGCRNSSAHNGTKIPTVSESVDVGLSGLKNFVSGGPFHSSSLIHSTGRLATSCTLGPFTSVSTATSISRPERALGGRQTTAVEAENVSTKALESSQSESDTAVDLSQDGGVASSAASGSDPKAVHLEESREVLDDQNTALNLSKHHEHLPNKELYDCMKTAEEMVEKIAESEHFIPPKSTDAPHAGDDEQLESDLPARAKEILSVSDVSIAPLLSKEPSGSSDALLGTPDGHDVDATDLELSLISSSEAVCSTPVNSSITLERNTDSVVVSAAAPSSSNPESADKLIISSTFKINPQMFDRLPSVRTPLPSISVIQSPAISTHIPSKLIPVSSVRIVAVSGPRTSLISSGLVAKPRPIVSVPVSCLTVSSSGVLPRSTLSALAKPSAILLATSPSASGSSSVTQKPASFHVIPPTVLVSSRAGGVPSVSGSLTAPASRDQAVPGSCFLVPASKLVKIGIPVEKKGSGQTDFLAQVLKSSFPATSGLKIQGTTVLTGPGSGFIQVNPITVSSVLGKQAVVVPAGTVPLNQSWFSASSLRKGAAQGIVGVNNPLTSSSIDIRQFIQRVSVTKSTRDVIEIPDDSDEEKCRDVEVDVLRAEVDGSNEATILREKLGIPLESCTSKTEASVTQTSDSQPPPKKKRKQMHEERVEVPMNIEFTESWVMIPRDKEGTIEETKGGAKEENKELPKERSKERTKEENKELPIERTKEGTNRENKEESKEEMKEETKGVSKEWSKDLTKRETNEGTKGKTQGETKEGSKGDTREDTVALPLTTISSSEAKDVPKQKEKRNIKTSLNLSNSSTFAELYSALFRTLAPYLKRLGEIKKKKVSKLFITRKAAKVIKHITERNRILLSELVSEKITHDRLQARLKSHQESMTTAASEQSTSAPVSSGKQTLAEKRRVQGPLRRKFRGISKNEELILRKDKTGDASSANAADAVSVQSMNIVLSDSSVIVTSSEITLSANVTTKENVESFCPNAGSAERNDAANLFNGTVDAKISESVLDVGCADNTGMLSNFPRPEYVCINQISGGFSLSDAAVLTNLPTSCLQSPKFSSEIAESILEEIIERTPAMK